MNSSILLQSVGTDRAESFGNYICSRKGSHNPPHPASSPWRRKNECIEMFLSSDSPLDGVGGASPHQDSHSHRICLELLPLDVSLLCQATCRLARSFQCFFFLKKSHKDLVFPRFLMCNASVSSLKLSI